jgi:uncharacterized membrane protein
MMQPYGRVMVMHFVILGGGFLVMALHSPVPALVVLVLLKIAVDVRAHRAERTRLGGETGAPAAAAEPSL